MPIAGGTPYAPITFLLHESIRAAAERHDAHEAFRFDGAALTYGRLCDRAARLANLLVDEGVRRGDRVGIYMTKGLDLPVAVYGVLQAGAAYVPIDPAAPLARVRAILVDCGLRHLVTNTSRERHVRLLAADGGLQTIVGLGADGPTTARYHPWEALDRVDARPPHVRVTEQDLAYIMYTSGSTGVPKGLMHTHASGMAYARLSARTYGVRPDDRLGNHSPLHFDMSTFEFLTGPLCGATTVIVPEEVTMFPVSLGELIERERLTFWYSVPLALIQLVTHGGIEQRDMRSLRWVMFGGEPFPPKYLWRLMDLWPHARFSNVYGPAEVNQCTFYHVPAADTGGTDAIPIGLVWDNAEGLIVDERDEIVTRGTAGELLVRAPTMMRGYWGRPDLNARAFLVREPLPGVHHTFYRTGDLVREREDGNLLFLGRRDRQVKVRGHRVELDEVEAILTSLAEVAEAAVVAMPDGSGSLEIAAAVLPRIHPAPSVGHLRHSLAERLPAHAMPARVEILTSLPRTATGKVDRAAVGAMLSAESG